MTRAYRGTDSLTREKILKLLGRCPGLTRREIHDRLDVQTAGFHLTRMVEDGILSVKGRPYQYFRVLR